MSHQGRVWNKEYQDSKLVTKDDKPQADTLRFFKFLKKEIKYKIEDRTILDLGCGTGRNSNYLAELGNQVIAFEVSQKALEIAKQRAKESCLQVDYRLVDIGSPYDLKDESVDLVLDVTSSNSLSEEGRKIYLKETSRVLRKGGYFFVRALAKDGDRNAKELLKNSPSKEKDTYLIPEMGLIERVFSKEDIVKIYSQYFKILHLEKKTNYSTFNNRIFKRNYWLVYLQK